MQYKFVEGVQGFSRDALYTARRGLENYGKLAIQLELIRRSHSRTEPLTVLIEEEDVCTVRMGS